MRRITDRERFERPEATEFDRPKGKGRIPLIGDVRPFEGLLRMPLVDAIIPPAGLNGR